MPIVCPTGCDAAALPKVKFDKCAPDWRASEIVAIAIGGANTPAFTDWLSPVEWAARLDQEDVVQADVIRLLTVRGNKPAPTETTQNLTRDRVIITNRRHVLNFMIDEVNDTNYDFVRTLECGALQFRIWIVTNGGKEIQGGDEGILVTAKASFVYDEGTGAIQRVQGTFEWNALISPERGLNPIAGI